MGIYINGMEMPDKNKTCYGYKTDYVEFRIWKDGTIQLLYGGYSKSTPYKAGPIPPHGRLIDADILYENCALDTNIDVMASAKRINEYMQLKIDDAPTVIPTEESE